MDSISNSIISSIATQSFKSKPILSSLLVGPTGTGKTYLTELIAKELGLKIQLIDMTSFKTPGAVNKFIELLESASTIPALDKKILVKVIKTLLMKK